MFNKDFSVILQTLSCEFLITDVIKSERCIFHVCYFKIELKCDEFALSLSNQEVNLRKFKCSIHMHKYDLFLKFEFRYKFLKITASSLNNFKCFANLSQSYSLQACFNCFSSIYV